MRSLMSCELTIDCRGKTGREVLSSTSRCPLSQGKANGRDVTVITAGLIRDATAGNGRDATVITAGLIRDATAGNGRSYPRCNGW